MFASGVLGFACVFMYLFAATNEIAASIIPSAHQRAEGGTSEPTGPFAQINHKFVEKISVFFGVIGLFISATAVWVQTRRNGGIMFDNPIFYVLVVTFGAVALILVLVALFSSPASRSKTLSREYIWIIISVTAGVVAVAVGFVFVTYPDEPDSYMRSSSSATAPPSSPSATESAEVTPGSTVQLSLKQISRALRSFEAQQLDPPYMRHGDWRYQESLLVTHGKDQNLRFG